MKVNLIFVKSRVKIKETVYKEPFKETKKIGVSDHSSMLVALEMGWVKFDDRILLQERKQKDFFIKDCFK